MHRSHGGGLVSACPPTAASIRPGDTDGIPRLILPQVGFAEALDTFVRPIREYKETTPTLMAQLMTMVGIVAGCLRREEDRQAPQHEAERIMKVGRARLHDATERERLERAYEAARGTLGTAGGA